MNCPSDEHVGGRGPAISSPRYMATTLPPHLPSPAATHALAHRSPRWQQPCPAALLGGLLQSQQAAGSRPAPTAVSHLLGPAQVVDGCTDVQGGLACRRGDGGQETGACPRPASWMAGR